jgi:hypothetical protein
MTEQNKVHHIDKDPTNNDVRNLQWCTSKEHSILEEKKSKIKKNKSAYICKYNLQSIFIEKYPSIDYAIQSLINEGKQDKKKIRQRILECCKRKHAEHIGTYDTHSLAQAYNYKWGYIEDDPVVLRSCFKH